MDSFHEIQVTSLGLKPKGKGELCPWRTCCDPQEKVSEYNAMPENRKNPWLHALGLHCTKPKKEAVGTKDFITLNPSGLTDLGQAPDSDRQRERWPAQGDQQHPRFYHTHSP